MLKNNEAENLHILDILEVLRKYLKAKKCPSLRVLNLDINYDYAGGTLKDLLLRIHRCPSILGNVVLVSVLILRIKLYEHNTV